MLGLKKTEIAVVSKLCSQNPLEIYTDDQGPGLIQIKWSNLSCFFKKIQWMAIMNFVQLPQFKVKNTEAQRHVAAFHKVAQLEDLDKSCSR